MYGTYRERDFFVGALVGGAIATLSALLFTTKKGGQIRHQVADAYEGAKSKVKEALSASKEKLEEKASEVSKSLEPECGSEEDLEDLR